MILDNLDNFVAPQYTIIGGGPASITLALELEKQGEKILIIEAGSQDYDEKSQDFYKGKIIGDDYFELDLCRLRLLGGSTGHYNGRLHPYDEIDFKSWPIKKKDVDPFLKKTKEIFEINNKFPTSSVPLDNFYLASHIVSPIHFGHKYYKQIKDSKNIFLILNCPVQLINDSKDDGKKVESINVIHNNLKKKLKVNKLILACGGIENSRILLWSRANSKTNFLKNSPIGNYWMEHPSGSVAHFIGRKDKVNQIFKGELETYNAYLVPEPKFVEEKKLNNCRLDFFFWNEKNNKTFKNTLKDLLCVAPVYGKKVLESIKKNQMLHCNSVITIQSEQKPDFENKIVLSKNKVDKLGVPRLELHWNVKDDFFESSRIVLTELANQFIDNDVGRIGIDRFIFDKTLKNIQTYRVGKHTENVFGGYHHMGGTRISYDQTQGVVDQNLKVHNVDNLYIAGSSVFPSGGHWNPTFTIVQLSLRLAKHLTT